MTDPVTNNFSFIQPTVGGNLNTWGGVLNNGVIAAVDTTLGSNLAVSITSTNVTLTDTQWQNAIFVCSGALTGNRSLILPLGPNSLTTAVGGRFIVVNNTTGNFTLTVLTAASGSTGITVPQGFMANLYSDGVNVNYGTLGLPAYAKAVNGNPNGQLAGTAGSVNTNASIAWDYTNAILYICTTTGDATGAVWTNPVSGSLPQPAFQGYLTPTSNTPIITGDVTATAIYYTPFVGTWVAIHNGSSIIPYRFSQMQLTLTTSQAANQIYDIYLAYNSGTPVIGTGPSWAAGSGGSVTAGSCARGTGAGGAAISRDSTTGFWVNTASISLIWNTGSGNTTITVPAGQGMYLGSIYVDSSAGQVTCHRSYGQSRKWGIFNAYNRQNTYLKAGDSTTSWTYATESTWRAANANSANSLTVFQGLVEEPYDFIFEQSGSINFTNASAAFSGGIGVNSTTSPSGKYGMYFINGSTINSQNPNTTVAKFNTVPSLGINVITALEAKVPPGTPGPITTTGTTTTFYGTEAYMCLTAEWRV